ncbi:hypothetical protein G647_02625 [Cladophialophora carrionii CBS 160.54]|uniref:Uncharacterized protein n=1 Tax=Cladophialophora carrionii CBS 160.54 TaxID=1279043 RepID=V9DHN0_9EURO|nr:uncharacterized protein G647_02625 [Cladophialophora carrionii CBS 160.54]ETI25848.1 hypothetical protein G647_02625 [Cladophialophora carrionii CBS 160.54]
MRVEKLAEGASNKVFLAVLGDQRLIVKIPDPVVPPRLVKQVKWQRFISCGPSWNYQYRRWFPGATAVTIQLDANISF